MNKLTIARSALIGLTATALSLPAFAGRRHHHDEGRYNYNDDAVIQAPVVKARPIFRDVRVNEPRQECRNERVVYRDRGGYRDVNVPGALIGGAIGGLAGNNIGGGTGRDIATGVGAVLGLAMGSQIGRDTSSRPTERVSYETRCDTYDSYRYESRVDGYDVTYRYNGRLYNTQLPYDPGRTIAVRVDVQPLR